MEYMRILFTDTVYWSEKKGKQIIVHSCTNMNNDNSKRLWYTYWLDDNGVAHSCRQFDTKREAIEYANIIGGVYEF